MLHRVLRQIREERGVEIQPSDIVYVDDRDIHIREIWENIGPVRFIQFGKDEVLYGAGGGPQPFTA